MIGEMCPAVDAAVGSVTVGQVSLEGFGLCHFHHLTVVVLLAGFLRAGAGRVAALLNLLTEETLEDASKSRRCCGADVWHAPHRHHRRKYDLSVEVDQLLSPLQGFSFRSAAVVSACLPMVQDDAVDVVVVVV